MLATVAFAPAGMAEIALQLDHFHALHWCQPDRLRARWPHVIQGRSFLTFRAPEARPQVTVEEACGLGAVTAGVVSLERRIWIVWLAADAKGRSRQRSQTLRGFTEPQSAFYV